MNKKTILVVEDEDVLREVWVSELSHFDATILEACNGKEAVEIIGKEKIDILITDIRMPIQDGFYVLDFIQEKSLQHIKIFVCSGYFGEEKSKLNNYKLNADSVNLLI